MADTIDTGATVDTQQAPEQAAPENVASQATEEPGSKDILNALNGEGQKAPETQQQTPEKYEINLPEGLSMTPEMEKQVTEWAKGLNLTQEQLNGAVKLHSEIMLGAMKAAQEQKEAMAKECIKAGLITDDKMRGVKEVFRAFDTSGKAMQEAVESGILFAPNFMRMLVEMGSALIEDTAPDNKPAAQAKSAADLLFGNSKY